MKYRVMAAMLAAATFLSGCAKISLKQSSDNEETYILPSDEKVITEVDLSTLNDTQLKYALEEVYARHGKIYNDSNLSKYFLATEWYQPDPAYSEDMLSDLERMNADYIAEYIEKNVQVEEPVATETPAPVAQTPVPQQQVIVVHDEPYYYEHYYGDNTYIIPDSSIRKLSAYELSGFSSDTLALIRNEIYARNGYVFQKEKYRNYFGSKQWYRPDPNFSEARLNEIEKYNIQLIKSLE